MQTCSLLQQLWLIALFAAVCPAAAQIVLSEIMFNPAGNERYDEFIELYNLSSSDTVDLAGWLISDSAGCNRITGVADRFDRTAGASDDSDLETGVSPGPGRIDSIQAASVLDARTPFGSTFSSFAGGTLLPPQSYAIILVAGYFINSNLYADRIPDGTLVLTIDKTQFGSYGLNNSRPERVSLMRPDSTLADAHAYCVPNDEGISEEKVRLAAGEAAGNWMDSQVLHGTPGSANSVTPAAVDSTLSMMVINEVMANPAAGEPEWIECYNAGAGPVRLLGWNMSDADTTRKRPLVREEAVVEPGAFMVLTGDERLAASLPAASCTVIVLSDWPGLNSSSEGVVLYDGLGRCVDALWYDESWGGARGISLERLSPLAPAAVRSNWGSSADASGHTAGRANSLLVSRMPAEAAIAISPNPFSPDGDGFDDHLAISVELPARTAHVNLRIFDSQGRQVRFLCNYEPSGSRKTVFWDGLDEQGVRCRIGIYYSLSGGFRRGACRPLCE